MLCTLSQTPLVQMLAVRQLLGYSCVHLKSALASGCSNSSLFFSSEKNRLMKGSECKDFHEQSKFASYDSIDPVSAGDWSFINFCLHLD